MNRSTLAKLAALVLVGTAATVTTVLMVDRGGHRVDGTGTLEVGRPSPTHAQVHTPPHRPAAPVETFTLTGEVAALYPGATRGLQVRITNPGNTAMRVTKVSVTVGDASAACRASNLAAGTYSGHALLGRHGTTSVAVSVRMLRTAPNACQNATFPLVFHAEAVKA